jgi:hypothetical protein
MAKEARSKREWLNAQGEKVTQPEEATQARYRLLGGREEGHTIDLSPVANQPLFKFAAGFGFFTKAGNVANTVLNSDGGSVEEADQAIADWFADWQNGTYVERAAGGVGARVNRDALAQAMFDAMTAAKRTTFKDGSPADYDSIRARLEEDEKGVLVRQWRQIPDVLNRYTEIVGKPTKSMDDI